MALVGLGIPEEDARFYEDEVKGGRFLVTVDAGEREAEAWAILRRCGAHSRAYGTAEPATVGGDTSSTPPSDRPVTPAYPPG